jgi:predicted Zn-dependent peptidase
MVKTLVVVLLIAGAGYFVYQQVSRTPSEEEMLVTHLSERYAVVVNKFTSASGRSGSLGMDTTYDSETVVVQIQKLRAELAELQQKLTEERAIRKADQLSEKIEAFCKKNEIIRP